jgi:hypothetical protein
VELLLQTLDELDDLVIGMRQAALPWLAGLFHVLRFGVATLHPAADVLEGAERAQSRI